MCTVRVYGRPSFSTCITVWALGIKTHLCTRTPYQHKVQVFTSEALCSSINAPLLERLMIRIINNVCFPSHVRSFTFSKCNWASWWAAPLVWGDCPFSHFQSRSRKLTGASDFGPELNCWTSERRKPFKGSWETQCHQLLRLFLVTKGRAYSQTGSWACEKVVMVYDASIMHKWILHNGSGISCKQNFRGSSVRMFFLQWHCVHIKPPFIRFCQLHWKQAIHTTLTYYKELWQ